MNQNLLKIPQASWIQCTLTMIFAITLLSTILAVFAISFMLTCDIFYLNSLGLHGSALFLHLLSQSLFAYFEHKNMDCETLQCSYTKTVGLVISAFQEDPWYLEQCLKSIKECHYPQCLLKIVMVVDGNTKEDSYMMEMFKKVFRREDLETYIWKGNYHSCGTSERKQNKKVEDLVRSRRCVCIMQKHGGKREVLYTAFKALGHSVDYIQVCDSDTKLNRNATVELVKVLESCGRYGAVGGDIRVLNDSESFISFMSSLAYWVSFNVESACQSYFNCVSCIRGSLGLYRNDLLQNVLESWYNQTFLGTRCTFGDDWHLTNQILKMGYGTKYTAYSHCYTETPAQLLRWLNQQIRWSKTYYRESLYNVLCWPKHHRWMVYESVITFLFPFLVTATVVKMFYTARLWHILWLLSCIQLICLLESLYVSWLRRSLVMVFLSAYSLLYLVAILPTRHFAICTIYNTSWGTSGRRKLVHNFAALVPINAWCIILFGGLVLATLESITEEWWSQEKQRERWYFIGVSVAHCVYWICIIVVYLATVRRCCRKRSAKYTFPQTARVQMRETEVIPVSSLEADEETTRL